MAGDERFNITFDKVAKAACLYNKTGYNRSYLEVYDGSFRDQLIAEPDEDSVRRLIKFVNSWRNRTPYTTLPELLTVLCKNTAKNASLRGVWLDSLMPDHSGLPTVQAIFEQLCRVEGFGATGASKFLGIIHPQLCVMWDGPIRKAYKYNTYGKKIPNYSDFLGKMRILALEVLKDADKRHGIADPADYISDKYGFKPRFTLATLVNHYVWVTFTLPLQKKKA